MFDQRTRLVYDNEPEVEDTDVHANEDVQMDTIQDEIVDENENEDADDNENEDVNGYGKWHAILLMTAFHEF